MHGHKLCPAKCNASYNGTISIQLCHPTPLYLSVRELAAALGVSSLAGGSPTATCFTVRQSKEAEAEYAEIKPNLASTTRGLHQHNGLIEIADHSFQSLLN